VRSRIARNLGPVLASSPPRTAPDALDTAVLEVLRDRGQAQGAAAALVDVRASPLVPPPELTGTDYAMFLLRVAAEVEHALMVQYLFTAYSLGGPDVPDALHDDVRAWQETILGIAKEEMGHLVTVENLLTLLGAPLNFNRDEFPFDNGFYPFPFRLVPASPATIATYVCAESPEEWDGPEADAIKQRAGVEVGGPINSVGKLYAKLIELIGDPARVPDAAFDSDSVAFQADFAEWGRGYRPGQRGRAAMSALPDLPAPELLILTASSRAEAIAALNAVGEQGEGLVVPEDDNESHFHRFLTIYKALNALDPTTQAKVVRPLATNPRADDLLDGTDVPDPNDPATRTPITNPQARLWANLHNVRYRKLLINLAHAFELSGSVSHGVTGPRGALIHQTFSEMYNLRAIAGILIAQPVDAAAPDGPRAAPPFQMPHTLMLPSGEPARWRLHRDLIDTSASLVARLTGLGRPGQDYLVALADHDAAERRQINQMLAAPSPAPTPLPTP
jgi:hypothetical protein